MSRLSKTLKGFDSLSNSLIFLPTPSAINSNWGFGSTLGLCLVVQILTGLFLAMFYTSDVSQAFNSVMALWGDVKFGWWLRVIHANGASLFFGLIFLHIGRGVYYKSYYHKNVWMSGVTMLLILMGTAFLGYVLPWGQMSFWGATVITNLISAVPYFGPDLVIWVWGGFAVGGPTLSRFFAIHYILPFILASLTLVHLILLHEKGSSNPLGLNSNMDKTPFFPFFLIKDVMIWAMVFSGFLILCFSAPWELGDPENFSLANPMVTPVHIKPEWYFLFAYAILRSIPNKLGGVLALIASVMVLYTLPLKTASMKMITKTTMDKVLFWTLVNVFVILTWIGGNPVEDPYILIGQLTSVIYFILVLMLYQHSTYCNSL